MVKKYVFLINFFTQEIAIFFKTFQFDPCLCWAGCGSAVLGPKALLQK